MVGLHHILVLLVFVTFPAVISATCRCGRDAYGVTTLSCEGAVSAISYISCPAAENLVLYMIDDGGIGERNFLRFMPNLRQLRVTLSPYLCRRFCGNPVIRDGNVKVTTNCDCINEVDDENTTTRKFDDEDDETDKRKQLQQIQQLVLVENRILELEEEEEEERRQWWREDHPNIATEEDLISQVFSNFTKQLNPLVDRVRNKYPNARGPVVANMVAGRIYRIMPAGVLELLVSRCTNQPPTTNQHHQGSSSSILMRVASTNRFPCMVVNLVDNYRSKGSLEMNLAYVDALIKLHRGGEVGSDLVYVDRESDGKEDDKEALVRRRVAEEINHLPIDELEALWQDRCAGGEFVLPSYNLGTIDSDQVRCKVLSYALQSAKLDEAIHDFKLIRLQSGDVRRAARANQRNIERSSSTTPEPEVTEPDYEDS